MSIGEVGTAQLSEEFSGVLLHPGDPGYEETRRIHNGMIDKRPALIACCRGTADVVAAVNFAREQSLEISVRGGGHNVAGRAVCEGGLMLDLARQKGLHVDLRNRTARAEGGVTWGEFNRETQLHGLATTGGVISTTGIAGLTLGGGIGYLMSRYGLSADNLLSAEVVTAEGRVLRAAADENDDLFWGLRGGGGNFGVVTSFEYQLHEVGPEVTGGLIAFPFDKAREVLRFYRDFTASLPDELFVFGALVHAPDGSGARLAAVLPCHSGSLKDGEAAVAPLKKFGSPVFDMIGAIPYTTLNTLLDAGYPRGALNYWKSGFLRDLSDEVIDTLITQFSRCPSPMSGLLLEHFHGAVTRVDPTATAFPHRHPGYNLAIISQWRALENQDSNVAWARETYSALAPHMAGTAYVNYLGDDGGQAFVRAAYGPNFQRLQTIKDRYDPQNLFHLNQNIPPSTR
ncbi:MAG: FAD-binding oxidoreductase [Acidobacteriota bacterium]